MGSKQDWNETLETIIGEKLTREDVKRIRAEEGISLNELSQKIGVAESDLAVFENGGEIDDSDFGRIFAWYYLYEEEAGHFKDLDEDGKKMMKMAFLLAQLIANETEEEIKNFFELVVKIFPEEPKE